MFTHPICHWAGGEVPPLLNYAPGQITDQYGVGPQLPPEQPFYYTSAEMVAAGVTAAPSAIYGFQEAEGETAIEDLVGANDLAVSGAAYVPRLHLPARGLWVGGDMLGDTKKGVYFGQVYQQRLAAPAGAFDPGAQSLAMFTILRSYWPVNSYRTVYAKKNSTTTAGYELRVKEALSQYTLICESTGGNTIDSPIAGDPYNTASGAWIYLFAYINQTTKEFQLISNMGVGAVRDFSAWVGSITSTRDFHFGYDSVLREAARNQVAYHAVWEGANAESVSNNWLATNEDILWNHDNRYNNCHVDADPTSGRGSASSHGGQMHICGDHSTEGDVVAGYGMISTPPAGNRQMPLVYDARISRAGHYGAPIRPTRTQMVLQTDYLTGTFWNGSGCTRDYAPFDKMLDPQGLALSWRMVATSNPGILYSDDITCVAGQKWAMGGFFKREYPETTDIPGCVFYAWDDNNLAVIDSITFTATSKWQFLLMPEFVIPAGCVDVQFRVSVPRTTADRYLGVWGCNAYQSPWTGPIMRYGVYMFQSHQNYQLYRYSSGTTQLVAGQFMKGAQGEIEIVWFSYSPTHTDPELFGNYSRAIASGANGRIITLNASDQIVFSVRNSVGVDATVVTSAAIPDITQETTVVCRWNKAGLPSGNKAEISINGGAYVGTNPAAWASSDTIDEFWYGYNLGTGDAAMLSGVIVSARVWEFPR